MLGLSILALIAFINVVSGYRLCRSLSVKLHSAQMLPLKPISAVNSDIATSEIQSNDPILVRAYRGEKLNRSPVWLMRQAGRYMAAFRKFSNKFGFRERSETPDIAIELSLQPWKAFSVDGVIMFSDILSPLPALGVDFTIIEGHGPKILSPLRTKESIENLKKLDDVDKQVPFIRPILSTLRKEIDKDTALIGFIGAPWTLAAYSVEGSQSRLCATMKTMCISSPQLVHQLLEHYTLALITYADHQIQCGAQILQLFDSWAHHLTEDLFNTFAKPYVIRIATYLQNKHPLVPIVYFANGGSAFLKTQLDIPTPLSLDWQLSMSSARQLVGKSRVIAGNVDPAVLYGSSENIRTAVEKCILDAGCDKHVLNLGHGVEKDTPESAVEAFVQAAKSFRYPNS